MAVLLTSCKTNYVIMHDGRTGFDAMYFPIDVKHTSHLSHIVSKKYVAIPLETHKDIILGKIKKLQFVNSKIFLICEGRNDILIFDDKGFFILKIGNTQLHKDLVDFDIYNGQIFVLLREVPQIMIYSLNGKLQGNITLKNKYQHICVIDENNLLLDSDFSNDIKKNIILYDYKEQVVVNSYLSFERNEDLTLNASTFHRIAGKKVLITQQYKYFVYQYESEKIGMKYLFSFNTLDQFPKNIDEIPFFTLYTKTLQQKSLVRQIDNLTQEGSKLYMTFRIDGYSYFTKVNLRTGKVHTSLLQYTRRYPFAFMPPIIFDNNKSISVIGADYILSQLKKTFPSDKHNDGLLEKGDNPVIFIRELKL